MNHQSRTPGWQGRLCDVITIFQRQVPQLQWGVYDCYQLIRRAVVAVYGGDAADSLPSPRYRTRTGAWRALRTHFPDGLLGMVIGLSAREVQRANVQNGDLVCLQDSPLEPCWGVVRDGLVWCYQFTGRHSSVFRAAQVSVCRGRFFRFGG